MKHQMTKKQPKPQMLESARKHFLAAVQFSRPHESVAEAAYVAMLARMRPPSLIDGAGNLHYDYRFANGAHSKTLFVAHTDTVAKLDSQNNEFVVMGDFVCSGGWDVLGADDGAGIAVLQQMMDNNVPGYYIFTRCEERGGLGSKYLAAKHPELMAEFDRAVAFDRKGTTSIITYQQGERCASDEFAEALAQLLADQNVLMMTDETGIYTDTYEFAGIIPECTNISVGYEYAHSTAERQNVKFLETLANAACTIDWESLPTKRVPLEAAKPDVEADEDWFTFIEENLKRSQCQELCDLVYDVASDSSQIDRFMAKLDQYGVMSLADLNKHTKPKLIEACVTSAGYGTTDSEYAEIYKLATLMESITAYDL